jgi:hypothetical protein
MTWPGLARSVRLCTNERPTSPVFFGSGPNRAYEDRTSRDDVSRGRILVGRLALNRSSPEGKAGATQHVDQYDLPSRLAPATAESHVRIAGREKG